MSERTVLFLCTGNYYRSRFAEIVFNHRISAVNSPWRARSSGLAPELNIFSSGAISPYTLDALAARGIESEDMHRMPLRVSEQDLSQAHLIIALKEAEHRPLLTSRHPGWENRVEYWHVHDLDAATADDTLTQIEKHVIALIGRLTALP